MTAVVKRNCATQYWSDIFIFATVIIFLATVATPAREAETAIATEEVTVSERPVMSSPTVTSSVITAEEIRATTARNAGDALRFMPGVVVMSGARRNHIRVSIRGFNPRYVKVYIDGVPVNSASDESVDLSTIPVEIIEKIEVIKGPAPVRYGSNAMAGIILITTKNGAKNHGLIVGTEMRGVTAENEYKQWMGDHFDNVEPDHDYYNAYSLDLAGGAGDSDLNAFVAGSLTRSEGWMPHSEYRNMSMWGKSIWIPTPKLEFSLTGGYFNGFRDLANPDRQLERRGGYGGGSGQGTGPMANSSNWEIPDWEKFHMGLSGHASTGRLNSYIIGYYYSDFYHLEAIKPKLPPGTTSTTWRQSDVYGTDISLEYYLPATKLQHVFGAGLSFKREDFGWSNSLNPAEDAKRIKNSAWAEYMGAYLEYTLFFSRVIMVAGVRHDERANTGSSIDVKGAGTQGLSGVTSPHFSFKWDITSKVDLHGAVSRTYRFPKLRDTYDYVSGNPDLKPETAWDYELGADYQPISKLIIKTAAFRNDVKDLIYSPGKFIQFENIGKARLDGFEFEVDAEQAFNGPIRKISCFTNYTYMYAYDLTNNRLIPYSPSHKADAGTLILFPYDLSLTLQYGWVSERATDDQNVRKLSAYDEMNAKISWQKKRGTVYLGIENLWDEKYQETLGFPQPGRTYLAGTRLTF